MTAPDACTHRWRIAEPNGPTSPGTCSLCGASRDFNNANALGRESGWQDLRDGPRGITDARKARGAVIASVQRGAAAGSAAALKAPRANRGGRRGPRPQLVPKGVHRDD